MQKIITLAILFTIGSVKAQSQTRQWDKPMQVRSCSIDIKADMFTATTFIEMEFCNPNNQEMEGLYRFELKPGQVITAFQLDLHGKYRDGSIEEKWKATNAYNTIVGKRIDPALLTMDYDGHYSLRIYPVPANGCRKITMTIQELLRTNKNELTYSLPLLINDTVRKFKLNIAVNGNTNPVAGSGIIAAQHFIAGNENHFLSYTAENILLKNPVSFSMPILSTQTFCAKRNDSSTYFALRFKPSVKNEYEIHPQKLTIFWDASGSLSKRDVNKEINFLKQFISFHNISQLSIIPFNYKLLDTAVFYTRNNFNSQWQQYLKNIYYDGATQLGCINMSGMDKDMVMLFSDGNNTYGKSSPGTANALVYCITTSSIANTANLYQIAGASGGKVIDLGKKTISGAIASSGNAENWLLNITSSSGKIIVEQEQPMEWDSSILINGTMPAGIDTLYFHYGNNNQVNSTEKIVVDARQTCSSSAIERITMLNTYDMVTHSYQWNNVIDFGLQEKVVTQNTAYIVLERIEDYIKYNITPPEELEEECKKLNYVKRDTRLERMKLEESNEFDIINKVIVAYNSRIKRWDADEPVISLTQTEFDKYGSQLATPPVVSNEGNRNGNTQFVGTGVATGTEVVVTALGVRRSEKAMGYSVTRVNPNTLLTQPDLLQGLQGRVPGVDIRQSQGVPGSAAQIQIRGNSSLGLNTQPLIVLDGMPVSGNILDAINVNDIESVNVLKGAGASALYGSRAANGVIIISSKKGRPIYNYYNNKPYRLKNMEDVDYMLEIKQEEGKDKFALYQLLREQYGGETSFYFDMAQHLYESGLTKEAFDVLMNGAESSNGSQHVLIAIAYILENWKQFNEAIKIYEELIKDNLNNLNLYRDLAWAHYQQGNYQQAINILFWAIKMNTNQQETVNLTMKSIMLNELNAIISLHKSTLDISLIPAAMIKPLAVDMRIVVESNKANINDVRVKEPDGQTCSYSTPVTKNGGFTQQAYYWYYNNPFEYQVKKAPEGKYKVRVSFYDSYSSVANIPSIIRVRVFKNFGKANQSISIQNITMDNQQGDIEIAEIKW